ncbi:MAG: hypothetical protein U0401_27585 [Anaerolineae bacterium]
MAAIAGPSTAEAGVTVTFDGTPSQSGSPIAEVISGIMATASPAAVLRSAMLTPRRAAIKSP